MKIRNKITTSSRQLATLTLAGLALFSANIQLRAGDPYISSTATPADTGFYFEGFGGVLFLDDLENTGGGTQIGAEFDTGWLAGGTAGYRLTPALSIELEGAYGEADLESFSVNGIRQGGFDGDLGFSQAVVNLIYECGPQNSVTPYLGFGIGAGFADADFSYGSNHISDDDSALYYQFIGGVKMDISANAKLFAEYRYGTLDEFSLRHGSGSIDFDELNAHQALFGIEIQF